MFSGPLEDQMAIRELHARYADAVRRKNAEDWAATWAEDANWSLMGTTVSGRDQIVGLWTQAMSAFDAVSFVMTSDAIELDGDTGTGRCQTHEILVEGGKSRVAGGAYEDEFVRRDGVWLYASRSFSLVAELRPE
jgi:uncharacterized protein (TIGR02246 family)